jgi:hypothetical protein
VDDRRLGAYRHAGSGPWAFDLDVTFSPPLFCGSPWRGCIHNLIDVVGHNSSMSNFFFQGLEDRAGNRCRFVAAQLGNDRGRDIFGPISRLPTIASNALAVSAQMEDFLLQRTVFRSALFERT